MRSFCINSYAPHNTFKIITECYYSAAFLTITLFQCKLFSNIHLKKI